MPDPRTEMVRPPQPDRGYQEGLPLTPETQARVNGMFRESGLADRMLSSLHAQGASNWTHLTRLESDCNFGVYQRPKVTREGFDRSVIETSAVIEFPNPDPKWAEKEPRWSQHFQVSRGGDFGYEKEDLWRVRERGHSRFKSGTPLNERQMQVVEEALALQQAEEAARGTK